MIHVLDFVACKDTIFPSNGQIFGHFSITCTYINDWYIGNMDVGIKRNYTIFTRFTLRNHPV